MNNFTTPKLLTIVVPVYKVEPYINKCLDSCILYKSDGTIDEDNMSKLEVIIVNDGTPDHSAEMSREYTVLYPQTFRQIDQENRGHGGAWNHGLKEATGKYIRFLDSDDWLSCLDKLMDKLRDCNADLVFTDYVEVNLTTSSEKTYSLKSDIGKTMPLTVPFLFNQYRGPFVMNFWHTTYKTSILQSQEPLFAEHVMYDDSILCIAPLLYGRTYVYWDLALYHYLTGRPEQSMDIKVSSRNVHSYVCCYERMVSWMHNAIQYNIPEEFQSCIRESLQHYATLVFGKMTYLPLLEAKKQMSLLYKEGSVLTNPRYKIVCRYEKLPFFLFYMLEKIRNRKILLGLFQQHQ